jgi:hypothetical protein
VDEALPAIITASPQSTTKKKKTQHRDSVPIVSNLLQYDSEDFGDVFRRPRRGKARAGRGKNGMSVSAEPRKEGGKRDRGKRKKKPFEKKS